LRRNYDHKGSIIDIAYRTFHLMMKSNTPQDLRLCDHVIEIENMSDVGTFDLSSLKKCITYGYDSTCRVLEKIHNTQ